VLCSKTMALLKDIRKYYRFCTGLRSIVTEAISLDESREIIKKRTERRESLFLNVVEKAIYGNVRSPYLKILRLAGCSLADIKELVQRIGIEKTLSKLVSDGVYLTFEEFKGRRKVMRRGETFEFSESDFDNPFLSRYFDVESGGTSGPGTRTMIDFDFIAQEAVHRALVLDVYGLLDAPCILWFPILPGNAGLMNLFRQAKIDRTPIKWFSQVDRRSIRPSLKDRFGTSFSVHVGRLFGSRMPSPEYVDLKEAHKIAQCVCDVIREHSKCSIWTYVNSAIRICTAAKERNLSLEGASFFVSGEPITPTKIDEIKSAGANAIPYYAFVEGGIAAYGCANPDGPDDMHVLTDRIAVISHEKIVEYPENTVDALLFTSLLPESPKILLNVETGDYGLIGKRHCGCRFEDFGFSDHMSNIRSFEKFTGEGMTFMMRDLSRIAEEVLPAKYGGSSSDYQVLKESVADILSHIEIAVSRRVGNIDEDDLVGTIIEELGQGTDSRRLMAEVWDRAGTIRVRRMDPIPTGRGKIFSFHSVEK
jgi:hypothetical protein